MQAAAAIQCGDPAALTSGLSAATAFLYCCALQFSFTRVQRHRHPCSFASLTIRLPDALPAKAAAGCHQQVRCPFHGKLHADVGVPAQADISISGASLMAMPLGTGLNNFC